MPRNPSTGVYSKPAGTTPSVGQVIDPAPWNALTIDLGNEITNSLPRDGSAPMTAPLKAASGTVSAPGLGFATNPQTGFYLKGGGLLGFTQNGADVGFDKASVYAAKSGDYTVLASDDNAVHRFTAAATLTLTAAATLGTNWHYCVIADGGDVTIDPTGSETIDGAATLIIPNGSSVFIVCNGLVFFTDRKLQPFAMIASAATTDLSTVGSQNVTVTGTTTITAFGTAAAGTFRRLVFSGILTLTHNATSLLLPQGGNVVTAAGDSLEVVSLGSGNWRVTSYQRVGFSGLISGAVVAASGTAIDFTGIPSWAKRITLSFESLSTNGTTGISIQLGDSGGIESTGYLCGTSNAQSSTTEFILTGGSGAAAAAYHGSAVLSLIDAAANKWAMVSAAGRSDVAGIIVLGGSKATSAVLDRIRVKTGNGVETLDAGSINILYE
ncbi:hypothetical protein [Rhizobium sp. NLR17b]|uniref:hypothetical protein n=1 Tax=unclassified Rhizobium TaxID=2613769 RepID=UPI002180C1C3|nr:hypothetical protein [Rhizobium sp. NLR17b]